MAQQIPAEVLAFLRNMSMEEIAALRATIAAEDADAEPEEGDVAESDDDTSPDEGPQLEPTVVTTGDLIANIRAAQYPRRRPPVTPVPIPMTDALEDKLERTENKLVNTLFDKNRRLGDLINLPLKSLVEPCITPGSYVLHSPEQVSRCLSS